MQKDHLEFLSVVKMMSLKKKGQVMEQPLAGRCKHPDQTSHYSPDILICNLQPQPRLTCQEGAGGEFQVTNRLEDIINHLHLFRAEKKYCLSYELFTR